MDILFTGIGVLSVSEVVVCENHVQVESFEEEERERMRPELVAFDHVFVTGKCRQVLNLDSPKRRTESNESHVG